MKVEYNIKSKEKQLLTEENLFEAFSSFEYKNDTIELTVYDKKGGDIVVYIVNIDTVQGAFLVHTEILVDTVYTEMGYDQLAEEVYELLYRNFCDIGNDPTFECRPCKSKIVFYD